MYLEKQGAEAKTFIDDWNKTPIEIKNIYGELYYGLAGLSSFKDSSDLPYIRELASWAVKYRFKQVCDAALGAFREMPEKENLTIIEAIWNEYSVHQWEGNKLQSYDLVRALEKHHYPEAIPLLVKFLNDSFVNNAAKSALVEIVGKDLGKEPEAWLKWYKAQKRKEEK
jgi:hypothetical protein